MVKIRGLRQQNEELKELLIEKKIITEEELKQKKIAKIKERMKNVRSN